MLCADYHNSAQSDAFYRQDFDFVAGRNEYEDVLQCNNAPSADTDRGHQFPAAFMIIASGLDKVRLGAGSLRCLL